MTTQLPPGADDKQPKALPGPTLEQAPEEMPEQPIADAAAPDTQFVLHVMSLCLAQKFADGGDTRYVAQNAFHTAREALGVLVAVGLMESTTIIRVGGNNEPLYKSPAVPPMHQAVRPGPIMG